MESEKPLNYFTTEESLHAFLKSCPLFQGIEKEIIKEIASQLLLKKLPGGTTLFSPKMPSDGVYLIAEGRLGIWKNNEEKPFQELSYKDSASDFAFLTHISQQITVKALRDSDLFFLPKTSIVLLLQKSPALLKNFCENLSFLLLHSIKKIPAKKTAHTIALLAQSENVPLPSISKALAEKMHSLENTLLITWKDAKRELPHFTPSLFSAWIRQKEEGYVFLLLECSHEEREWTRHSLQRADQILLVADSDDDSRLSTWESVLWESPSFARIDLILLQSKIIQNTFQWLEPRKLRSHQHLFLNDDESLARLSRILTGKSLGVVLSGGGARGIAQIGFLIALMEKKVPIDFIGGTSIGAIISALYALGWDKEKLDSEPVNIFVKNGGLIDFTLPLISLIRGKKAYDKLNYYCGDTQIEDLKTTFFCMSANLTLKTPVIHSQGSLKDALRASISLPGVFPPVFHNHSLLVDGGMFHVIPAEQMRMNFDAAKIIAVDVSIDIFYPSYAPFPPTISGWKLLFESLFSPSVSRLHITDILSKSTEISGQQKKRWIIENHAADFYLKLPVGKFKTLEFSSYEEIKNQGYAFTKEILKEWKTIF